MPRIQSDDELRKIVAGYIDAVLSGRRTVGRLERLAVERHVRDLEQMESGERDDWRFSEEAALIPLRIAVEHVRHTKSQWAGQRYRFCEGSAWIAFLFWSAFGWYQRRDDGRWDRRFNEIYCCTARKQGKSMIAAILAAVMYLGLGEAAPEIYFAATQKQQAAIAWKQMAGIIRKDPDFNGACRVHRSSHEILLNDEFEATCKALSRNDDEFDGFNPFLFVLDEFHAHPDSGMYDVLRSGQRARRGAMRLLITTRGRNAESACGSYEKTAIKILEGVVEEDSTLVYIAALDEGDDYRDESVWPKANPNIGVSVFVDELRKDLRQAENDPSKLPEFLRTCANAWTRGEKVWMTLEEWDACEASISLSDMRGEECYAAVDVSMTADFTALVLDFPRPDGEHWVFPFFWIPEETVDLRVRRDKVPVNTWVRQGFVEITPGPVIDQDAVKEKLIELRRSYLIREVPLDQAQSWKLNTELEKEGFKSFHFSQAASKVTGAIRETEIAIRKKTLKHAEHPCMRWMMSNVQPRDYTTGLRRLDKDKSVDRIDGPQAMIMAVGRAVLNANQPRPGIHIMGGGA